MHAPIPEAVPMHEPELPTYAPNPYEAQPAEYAALDPVAPQVPEATQVPVGSYDQSNYVHYSQTGDVYAAAAPLQVEPIAEAYVADPYAPNPYVGNTAVNLNHNPYAAGQIQAGSLEPQPQQQQPMPNPYLPPQS